MRWLGKKLALSLVAGSMFLGTADAAEIDPGLIERAKKEGQVTFYTNIIVNQLARPMADAFEKKYGIKVNISRADSQGTILKLVNEARAGKTVVDVWNLSSGLSALVEAGVTKPFKAVNAAELPPAYKDPNGVWVATNIYVLTPGYNTDLVSKADVPKTFDDLLNPKWKGKLAWKPNDISGAPGFIGNVMLSMGEEKGMAYLKKLAEQQPVLVEASARAILDRVIAGQYPIALQIFNHHAVISAAKGAPAAWIPMSPATVAVQVTGLTKDAPNPNAGLLLIEFMLSDEGQKIFQQAEYLPANPRFEAMSPELKPEKGGFSATVLTPDKLDEGLDKWNKIFQDLFRK